ncbi:MAG: hypothetical protein JW987_03445 [Anaerolineaceae bacterium]|nr:hypothetical protein [Anaerolineaceae bacterium]
MTEITSLSIPLPNGSLTNTFFRVASGQGRLAFLFPGRGYTCAMPVLYYPGAWLQSRGADVLAIEYTCTRQPGYDQLPPEDKQHALATEVDAAVQAALAQDHYTEIVFVGKSLGTLALAHLAVNSPLSSSASFIWLTPLVKQAPLRSAVAQARPRSLFVSGTADPLYDPAFFAEVVQSCRGESLLIPNADHVLEIPGDLPASLEAMRRVLNAIASFILW